MKLYKKFPHNLVDYYYFVCAGRSLDENRIKFDTLLHMRGTIL